jgi:hypothetical protein
MNKLDMKNNNTIAPNISWQGIHFRAARYLAAGLLAVYSLPMTAQEGEAAKPAEPAAVASPAAVDDPDSGKNSGSSVSIKSRSSSIPKTELLEKSGQAKDQDTIYDWDQRFVIIKKEDKPDFQLDWAVNILQEFHNYNNTDLRELNSESDLEIRHTDDRTGLALTRAKIDGAFLFPEYRLGLALSWGFDGVWGHDQLQGFSNPGTRIGRANVFWNFAHSKTLDATVTMGRQFFTIGGGMRNDYMQKDILDAVVLDFNSNGIVEGHLLLLDVYSGANNFGSDEGERWNDEFQFFTRDDGEVVEGINGDVSTYRWGAVFSFKEPVSKSLPKKFELDPRVYGFYALVRGNGGGLDRSENGAVGNFSDNDWSALGGGRLVFTANKLSFLEKAVVYGDAAYSMGTDLKRKGEPAADYQALGFGTGMELYIKSGIKEVAPFLMADMFHAQGPEHNSLGNRTSHGFVSFKGDEIGGLLFRRYWGVHPSAYVDDDGIDSTPYAANRKSGTMMLHVGLGTTLFKKFLVQGDFWHTVDTGSSDVPFTKNINGVKGIDLAAGQNPFLSKEELRAQQRLGKTIGQEINVKVEYNPNQLLKFYLIGAYFLPGEFFDAAVADVASPNGVPKGGAADAKFWGLSFGSQLAF